MNEIDIQFAVPATTALPTADQISMWANAALKGRREEACLSIRITDEDEITELNNTYRGKNKATNVLSFPMDVPQEVGIPMIGDIAICATVVEQEALEQGKTLVSHWAHMVIHGTLHLLGYDHIEDSQAVEMEALEVETMQGLGYPNPYQLVENS